MSCTEESGSASQIVSISTATLIDRTAFAAAMVDLTISAVELSDSRDRSKLPIADWIGLEKRILKWEFELDSSEECMKGSASSGIAYADGGGKERDDVRGEAAPEEICTWTMRRKLNGADGMR